MQMLFWNRWNQELAGRVYFYNISREKPTHTPHVQPLSCKLEWTNEEHFNYCFFAETNQRQSCSRVPQSSWSLSSTNAEDWLLGLQGLTCDCISQLCFADLCGSLLFTDYDICWFCSHSSHPPIGKYRLWKVLPWTLSVWQCQVVISKAMLPFSATGPSTFKAPTPKLILSTSLTSLWMMVFSKRQSFKLLLCCWLALSCLIQVNAICNKTK